MTRKTTGARVSKQGAMKSVELVEQTEDTPLPSAVELERLHSFRPDLIDQCVTMIQEENIHRRKRLNKVDWMVFAERMLALILVGAISVAAFVISYYLAMANHEATASVVTGGTLAMIVAAILKRK